MFTALFLLDLCPSFFSLCLNSLGRTALFLHGRRCPGRRAEARTALPGGSPAHLPRPGSGPTGRAWAVRSDAAVPAWHQGHSARGGGDEGGRPRVATAAPESRHRCCSGFGARDLGEKGCLEASRISRPFCWTFRPPWTPPEELSSPAGSDFALRFPGLPPGFPAPRWSIRVGSGLGWRRQPHARTRTRSEEGERQRPQHHLQCQCGAPAEAGKAALAGKEPGGRGQRGWRYPRGPESWAAPEPAPCTHAHTYTHTRAHTHTHIHIGTRRAFAPVHVPPGHPRRCGVAGAGISRVLSPLTLWDSDFANPDFRVGFCAFLPLPPGPPG